MRERERDEGDREREGIRDEEKREKGWRLSLLLLSL